MGRPDVTSARRPSGRDRSRYSAWPLLAGLACFLFAASLAAQDGCEFGEDGNDVLRQVTMAGGEAIYYVTRPHMVCEGGIQIWADSAVAFTSTDMAHLIGSVRYEDPRRSLRSDEARYFSAVGRLQAAGSLRIEDRDEGSVVENGALVYLRETSFRSEETMTVTTDADRVRPKATLTAREAAGDSGGTAREGDRDSRTYVIVGDEIFSRGDSYLRSVGSVELSFDSVLAFADTLEYLEVEDHLELRGRASVDAPDYDLAGQRIVLMTPEPAEREIRALGEAVLTGDDLVLTSERIFLFARDERLHRLVALPPEVDSLAAATAPGRTVAEPGRRPHALADDFEITADSLDVLAPGESLERVFAAGRARSVSHSRDSLNVELLPEVARSDWLEGDTIIVTFVPSHPSVANDPPLANDPSPAEEAPVPPHPDAPTTESGVSVDRIVAIVGARSLYRMIPSDPGSRPGEDPPAVHYVVGDRITIVMRDGEVDHMEVEGGTSGIHLEPLRPGPQP